MAALEIGSVNATPTMTETRIPMRNGCWVVAHMIRLPTLEAAVPMYGANKYARPQPEKIVTSGVTMMSTFVFLLTSLPEFCRDDGEHEHREEDRLRRRACFAAPPTATSENSTSGGAPAARKADGDRHSGTGCGLCIPANLIEQRNVKLCAERGNDGADEQGSKSPCAMALHGIDKVAVQIHLDFAFFFGRSSSIFVQSFFYGARKVLRRSWVLRKRALRRIREKESILTMLPSASVRFRKNAAPPGDSRAIWSQRPRNGGTSAGGRLGYALKNTTNFPCLQGGCKDGVFHSFLLQSAAKYGILGY